MRRLLWACLLPAALSGTASADLITLRNGRVMEGETEATPGGLWVKRPSGSVLLAHREIVRVEARETPWEALDRRLASTAAGDYGGVLEVAFFALDVGQEAELERVVAKALTDPLTPADLGTVRLGMLCLERDLREQARILLVHAIAADPRSPTAALGLQRLDFHWDDGRWQAPEEYYPAQGYVRFEDRWALPEEVRVSEAQRALVAARARAADADDALRRAERRLDRARDDVPDAEVRAARAQAQVEQAREALRAFAQDLQAAEQHALAARYDARSFAPPPCTLACGVPHQPRHTRCAGDQDWVRRRARDLAQASSEAQAATEEARRRRDLALRELEEALECEAHAPRWLADARAEVLEAAAAQDAANLVATQAALELQAAELDVQAARRALVAARRG